MNKGNLDKQIQLLERDLIKRKFKIDMERRNILKSFQAIRRTSGNSDMGMPPEGRMDNIYAHSKHSKCGLRLSEKRLMEWKRRERELRRFMREMTIGSNLDVGSRLYKLKRPKMVHESERDSEEHSAKIFRLYQENDKIQPKLEPRTKNCKIPQLDKNHFIKIPCNAYIQDDLAQIVLHSDPVVDMERLTGNSGSRSYSAATSSSIRTIPILVADNHEPMKIEQARSRGSARIGRTGSGRHRVTTCSSEWGSVGRTVSKDSLEAVRIQTPMKEERARSSDRSGSRQGSKSRREHLCRPTSSRSRNQGLSPMSYSMETLATSPEVTRDTEQIAKVSSGRPKSAKQQQNLDSSRKLSANLNRSRRGDNSHERENSIASKNGFLENDQRASSQSRKSRSPSRSGNRSSLSNGTEENFLGCDVRTLTSASSRARSARSGGIQRMSRSPSSRASNSLGFIADLFNYDENIRRSRPDSSDSVNSTLYFSDERLSSARRTPKSSDSRVRATLLCPTKHDCLKSLSLDTPRPLAVKKSSPHVHSNYLYAPYVLDTSEDESESEDEDSFFDSDSVQDDTEDEHGIQVQPSVITTLEHPPTVQSNGVDEEVGDAKQDSDAVSKTTERGCQVGGDETEIAYIINESDTVSKGVIQRVAVPQQDHATKESDAVSKGGIQRATVQKQVRFSDNEETKQCDDNKERTPTVNEHSTQTMGPQIPLKFKPAFQTTGSQTTWSSGAEYARAYASDPRRHSLPKSSRYHTIKQNKTVATETHPTKHLRKTQSDIFVEHPPKINSTRPLTIGSVFNVSIALSKLTRKKSLRDLVKMNNPDVREAVRQERLKDLEIKSKRLSEEANKFYL